MRFPSNLQAYRGQDCRDKSVVIVLIAFALAFVSGVLPAGAATPTVASPTPIATTTPSVVNPPGSTAPQRATFGIAPVTLGKSDARGYFSYQMGVGGSYSDKVAVLNYGATPLALSVFAADLENADDGSIAVGLQTAASKDAGGWVKLAKKVQFVVVPPTSTKTGVGRIVLPFRIAVPNDAPPGDHAAAIVAVLSTLGKNPKGQNVKLDQRIATRMYLRVAGPLHPSMTIENMVVKYGATVNPVGKGDATVSYVVHNTGNVRLGASQKVAISGIFGVKTKPVIPSNVALLLPGAKQPVTLKVSGVRPTGWEKARVSIVPLLFQDQTAVPIPNATVTKGFHAVPFTLLALVLILIALVALVLYLRRRRARGSAGPQSFGRHGGPDGPDDNGGPRYKARPMDRPLVEERHS